MDEAVIIHWSDINELSNDDIMEFNAFCRKIKDIRKSKGLSEDLSYNAEK